MSLCEHGQQHPGSFQKLPQGLGSSEGTHLADEPQVLVKFSWNSLREGINKRFALSPPRCRVWPSGIQELSSCRSVSTSIVEAFAGCPKLLF